MSSNLGLLGAAYNSDNSGDDSSEESSSSRYLATDSIGTAISLALSTCMPTKLLGMFCKRQHFMC